MIGNMVQLIATLLLLLMFVKEVNHSGELGKQLQQCKERLGQQDSLKEEK